jgi:transposase
MDAANLSTITDPAILRALVAEKLAEIEVRDQRIAERDQRIAERDQRIVERDQRIAERDQRIAERDKTIRQRELRIEALTHEIARLRRVQFGARSERMPPEQRSLFEETLAADIAAVEAELATLASPTQEHTARAPREVPKRRPLPPELPRVTTLHEPDTCTCGQCGGAMVKIGEHVRERLACKPIEFYVERDIFPQYACKPCERVVAEPVPAAILDRSQFAPSVQAQVVIAKYLDHMPLYRQEALYARSGIELPRSTQAEMVGAVGVALQPLVVFLHEQMLTYSVLHADETPVEQLEPGRGKTRRAYLFAYRTAGPHPLILFDYCPSRSGEHARRFLGHWRGALMVDDFAGYKALFQSGVTELACWAHARRKFVDLEKASGSAIAKTAIERIAVLYRIEDACKDLDDAGRHAYRQQHAKPVVEAFHAWLRELQPKVMGSSGTAKAIEYCLRRWDSLARYLDDGRYPIDNNPVENAIRPIALGRRNWLFAGSETAGKRAAAIMSLLATAKANGHDPHAWLSDVLERLPTTRAMDIADLLPHAWVPAAR